MPTADPTWTDGVAAVSTAVAVVVGGVWAYYRYLKSYVVGSRGTLSTEGSLRVVDGVHIAVLTTSFTNQSNQRFKLTEGSQPLEVRAATASQVRSAQQGTGFIDWHAVTPLKGGIFAPTADARSIVEPGETIKETTTAVLPATATVAQLTVEIGVTRRRWGFASSGRRWVSTATIVEAVP